MFWQFSIDNEPPGKKLTGTAVGIDQHAELSFCDPLAIDNCHYQIDVRVFELQLERVTDLSVPTGFIMRVWNHQPDTAPVLRARRCRNDSPCGRKQLQPVVFDRIVAGRNLNSAGRTMMLYQHSGRRSGLAVTVAHIPASRPGGFWRWHT